MLNWAKKHVHHAKHKDAANADEGETDTTGKDKWQATSRRKISREEKVIREEEQHAAPERKLEEEKSPSFTRKFASLRKMATLKRSTDKRDKSKSPDKGTKEKSRSPDKSILREKSRSPDKSSDTVSWYSVTSRRDTSSRSPDRKLDDNSPSPDKCSTADSGDPAELKTTQEEQRQKSTQQQQQQQQLGTLSQQQQQQPGTISQQQPPVSHQQQPSSSKVRSICQLATDTNGQSTDDCDSNAKSVPSQPKMPFENGDPGTSVETGVDKETKKNEDRENENVNETETKDDRSRKKGVGDNETVITNMSDNKNEETGITVKEETSNHGELKERVGELKQNDVTPDATEHKESAAGLESDNREPNTTTIQQTESEDKEGDKGKAIDSLREQETKQGGDVCSPVRTIADGSSMLTRELQTGNDSTTSISQSSGHPTTSPEHKLPSMHNKHVPQNETYSENGNNLKGSTLTGEENEKQEYEGDTTKIIDTAQDNGSMEGGTIHTGQTRQSSKLVTEKIEETQDSKQKFLGENGGVDTESPTKVLMMHNKSDQTEEKNGPHVEEVNGTGTENDSPVQDTTDHPKKASSSDSELQRTELAGILTEPEGEPTLKYQEKNKASCSDKPPLPLKVRVMKQSGEQLNHNGELDPLHDCRENDTSVEMNGSVDRICLVSDPVTQSATSDTTSETDGIRLHRRRGYQTLTCSSSVSRSHDTFSYEGGNSSSQSLHGQAQRTSSSSLTNIQVQKVSTPSQSTQLPSPLEKESSASSSSLPSTQTLGVSSQTLVGGSLPASPSAPKRHKRASPVPSTRSLQTLHPTRQKKPGNKMCDTIISNEFSVSNKALKEMPVPAPRKIISLNPFDSEEDEDEESVQENPVRNEEKRSADENVALEASRARKNTKPTPVPAPRTTVSLNPFDSDDDEEEELTDINNKNAKFSAASGPLKPQVIGKNPFEDDEDEEEEDKEKEFSPQRTSSPSLTSYCVAASSFGKLSDSYASSVSNKTFNETTSTNPFDEDDDDEDAVGDDFKRDLKTRQSYSTSSSALGMSRDGTRASLPPAYRSLTSRKKRQAPLPPGQSPRAEKPRSEVQNLSRGSSVSSLIQGGSSTSLNMPDSTPPKRPPPPRPPPPKLYNTNVSPAK